MTPAPAKPDHASDSYRHVCQRNSVYRGCHLVSASDLHDGCLQPERTILAWRRTTVTAA
jgi:hypothetical protein